MQKQVIQRRILFRVESFANVKFLGFYIKPLSEHLNMRGFIF